MLDMLLILHIAAGSVALLSGFMALLSRKGQRLHLLSGRIFFYAMLLIGASAVVLAIFRPNTFLLLIAFFALYQNLNGYRAIRNKSLKPTWIDWLITIVGFTTGIQMLLQGNIVLWVFGGISCFLAIGDVASHVKLLRGRSQPKNAWLLRHIGMMMGAYIATVTAFVVVNISYPALPWVPWLAPTVLGVPVMIWFQRKYTTKPIEVKAIETFPPLEED